MSGISSFGLGAQSESLDGVSQNNRWCPLVFGGRLECSVDLDRIVSAASQMFDLAVAQMFHQFQQIGMATEEVLADVIARFDAVLLELAIDHFTQRLHQDSRFILFEQRVPVASPDELDDVPARAAEDPFQFLDDLAIASNWTVKSLQVAVYNPGQVVEVFT